MKDCGPGGNGASGQGAGNTSKLNVMSKELFLSLYLPAMAISLGEGIATPVLPVYAKSFGISFETATLVVILNGIGGWVATVPIGYMIDRFGRRPVLLAGPLLTAVTATMISSLSVALLVGLLIKETVGRDRGWHPEHAGGLATTATNGKANKPAVGAGEPARPAAVP